MCAFRTHEDLYRELESLPDGDGSGNNAVHFPLTDSCKGVISRNTITIVVQNGIEKLGNGGEEVANSFSAEIGREVAKCLREMLPLSTANVLLALYTNDQRNALAWKAWFETTKSSIESSSVVLDIHSFQSNIRAFGGTNNDIVMMYVGKKPEWYDEAAKWIGRMGLTVSIVSAKHDNQITKAASQVSNAKSALLLFNKRISSERLINTTAHKLTKALVSALALNR